MTACTSDAAGLPRTEPSPLYKTAGAGCQCEAVLSKEMVDWQVALLSFEEINYKCGHIRIGLLRLTPLQ